MAVQVDGILWTEAQSVEESRKVKPKYKVYVYRKGKASWHVLWEKARWPRASLKHLTLILEGSGEEPRGILSRTAPG